MAVLQQTVIFFLIMLIGIYARRKGIITPDNQNSLSALVVNIAYPCIIVSAALSTEVDVSTYDIAVAFVSSWALLLISMLLLYITAKIIGFEQGVLGVVVMMSTFTSIGFMGVPLIAGAFGPKALIYISVFLLPSNLLFYSAAIGVVKGSGGFKFKPRDLVNNGIIACFVTIFLYFSGITLPYVLSRTIQMIGSMTGPLAMLLLGSFFVDIKIREMFSDLKIVIFTAVKMIAIPVIIVKLFSFFIDDVMLLSVCMAAAATPCGNVVALLCSLYNQKAYPASVKGISLSTLVCVATIPLCYYLAGL